MAEASGKSNLENMYSGHGASALPDAADVVKAGSLTPHLFWEQYVSQRKPVIVDGHLADSSWKASELWTDEYLIKQAGDAELEVEVRESMEEGYGKGRKTRMTLAECLRRMAAGDSSLYLTTQKVATGEDGHPEVFGPPLLGALSRDLPVQPSLLGRLVPQQINLWAGCAPEGSSSGLHHDYHDNLYVLLRGRKRFRLYPPSMAGRMYVHGKLRLVHPNGRIVHESQGDVLADGSSARDVAQWKARSDAEAELRAAEEALARGDEGAEERLEAAERRLEEALDAALEAEVEGESELLGGEEDDEEESKGEEEEGEEGAGRGDASAPPQATGTAGDPDSFSRVDLSRPPSELEKEFPLFPGVDAALVCDVHAGQMLFVPAGWFHEVTSFSSDGSSTHMALNYWCHPPDGDSFDKPYKSGYWPDIWLGRVHKYAPAAVAAPAGTPEETILTPPAEPAAKVQAGPSARKETSQEPAATEGEEEGEEAAAEEEEEPPQHEQRQQRKRKRGQDEDNNNNEEEEERRPAPGLRARLASLLHRLIPFLGRRQDEE